MAPTLVASRTALPPRGAELAWERPGAALTAPTLVASRTALDETLPEAASLRADGLIF
ncbi:MAG: hypothetical protein Q8K38_05605 [Burkholderiaceae bacterium]|nr:hypothetical protein [Burkholderiaceae bacterium]MDZ4146177.1 hypothetical protein [Burkholderiales bacterium]